MVHHVRSHRSGLCTIVRTAACLLGALATHVRASVWHVDGSLPVDGPGSTWAAAFNNIDSALAVSSPSDEIWVRQLSTPYRPTIRADPADPRSVTFVLPPGVRLIGGFKGTETQLPPTGNRFASVLDGDVGAPGFTGDDAYHVVTIASGTEAGRLERFTIQKGNASGTSGEAWFGGGILCISSRVQILDCRFVSNAASNRGGAIYALNALVDILRCSFESNVAGGIGGAIRGQVVSMNVQNCTFFDNRAVNGGAIQLSSIYVSGSGTPNVQLQNCLFLDNRATAEGGAVRLSGGPTSSGAFLAVNCTFAGNSASGAGGAISAQTTTHFPAVSLLRNCIVWGNAAPTAPELHGRQDVAWSDIQGGYSGVGNLNADPLFTRAFSLSAGSPCIDAAQNAAARRDIFDLDRDNDWNEPIPFDLSGISVRFRDDLATPDTGSGSAPVVDMGAFEF